MRQQSSQGESWEVLHQQENRKWGGEGRGMPRGLGQGHEPEGPPGDPGARGPCGRTFINRNLTSYG